MSCKNTLSDTKNSIFVKSDSKSDEKPNKLKEISSVALSDNTKQVVYDNNYTPEVKKLYIFMAKYRNKKNDQTASDNKWTNSCVSSPFGSYNIPDDMYQSFLSLYTDAILSGGKLHITENHKEIGPIVIDLDFKSEIPNRTYTEETIIKIVKIYNEIINKYLKVERHQMNAYVMEKQKPSLKSGKYCDGIHIIYPNICTKPNLQFIMRNDFIKKLSSENVFDHMKLENSIDNIVDKNVICNTGWLLYGSCKNPVSYPYYVSHIYYCSKQLNTKNNKHDTATDKIYDICLPKDCENPVYIKHFIQTLRCRKFSNISELTEMSDVYDPIQLENKMKNISTKMINEASDKSKKSKIQSLVGNDCSFIKAVSEKELVEAKNLTSLLSIARSTEYYSWYQIGKCLHNIDYRLLEDWIKFSNLSPKCNKKTIQNECETLWRKMKDSNYSLATLHYFASQDNLTKYKELQNSRVSHMMKNALDGSHTSIAMLLMEKYKYRFKCASIKHKIWYEFISNRWVEVETGYTLRNLITKEIAPDYAQYNVKLVMEANQYEGYDQEQRHNESAKVGKLLSKLKTPAFKEGVMKECADMAFDPDFLKRLDENAYLLCFNNGVYDLEEDRFRPGCPDDYISLCTGYNYINYDEDDIAAKEIDDFLSKIQIEPEMCEYVKLLLSTCLAGSISEENFYILTGTGANGKSKLMELLKYSLGDYYKPMDIRLLVEKRGSSSSASPELADKKGIRACPFDEPKSDDEINTGFMKIFTGGDLICARALFKEPIYFKPQFKPFLLCNDLPSIRSDDDGTWRRIKVIPFSSKFHKPDESTKQIRIDIDKKNSGHFWADLTMSEKLPEWRQMFMSLLIKYYKIYKVNGLKHPKLVTKHTDEYRKKCDVFQDFISDYLEKTGDQKDKITILNLHGCMRSWFKTNFDGKCPTTKDLRVYVSKKITSYVQKTDSLHGYKLKEDQTVDDNLANI